MTAQEMWAAIAEDGQLLVRWNQNVSIGFTWHQLQSPVDSEWVDQPIKVVGIASKEEWERQAIRQKQLGAVEKYVGSDWCYYYRIEAMD